MFKKGKMNVGAPPLTPYQIWQGKGEGEGGRCDGPSDGRPVGRPHRRPCPGTHALGRLNPEPPHTPLQSLTVSAFLLTWAAMNSAASILLLGRVCWLPDNLLTLWGRWPQQTSCGSSEAEALPPTSCSETDWIKWHQSLSHICIKLAESSAAVVPVFGEQGVNRGRMCALGAINP